jgi:hypothetical protein
VFALLFFTALTLHAQEKSAPSITLPPPKGSVFNSMGGFAMGPPVPMLTYDGRYLPGEKSPVWTENRLTFSAPVYRSNQDTVAASLSASQLHLSDNLRLDSGVAVPAELSRIEAGFQYFHKLPDKRNWGLRTSVGYAGDKPFRTTRDLTYSFSASYGYPSANGSGYWALFVFMANNSPFLNYFPFPGVTYIYKTPTFTGVFGFPILSMQWTAYDPWIYSLSIFGPTLLSEAAYGPRETLQTFAGFSLVQQSYVPSERAETRDRLTLQEDKLALGMRRLFAENVLGEWQVGRTFDRTIFEGNGFRNKDRGKLTLPTDWLVAASVKWAW